MDNFINYIYIITNIGFIINSVLLLLTIGGIWSICKDMIPMKVGTYSLIACALVLLLFVAKGLFILFVDKERFIDSNNCISLYCDAVNVKFAIALLIINVMVLFIKFMQHSLSFDMFDDVGVIICLVVFIISGAMWWHYVHFSSSEECKVFYLYGLGGFWNR